MFQAHVLHTVVVTCLGGMALVTRVVDAGAPSALPREPTRLCAQLPAAPNPADTRTTGGAVNAEDLTTPRSNPITSLIRVP